MNQHRTSLGLGGKHAKESSPKIMGSNTSYDMENTELSESGNQHTQDHLILLTPEKVVRIDHGGRNTNRRTGLGMYWGEGVDEPPTKPYASWPLRYAKI
jgi:hypothetical protein